MKYFIFVIALFFSSFAYSQNEEHYFDLESVPVREFVTSMSDMLDKPIIVKPSVTGDVSVYNATISEIDLLSFFIDVMESHDYSVSSDYPLVVSNASSYDVPRLNSDKPLLNDSGSSTDFTTQLEVPDVDIVNKVYSFDNVRADDVLSVVKSTFNSTSSASFNDSSAVVMAGSNSIAVSAPQGVLDFIDTIHSDLDTINSQVFIRAVFYETSLNSSFDLGVGMGTTSKRSPGTDVVGGSNTNSLSRTLSSAGGTFGIFDGDMLALALRAVQRDGTAKLLSTPQVLTQSGSQGRINVGQVVPVVTGRVTGEAASVDSPFQTIERISVGLGLTVNPVVLANDRIVMNVTASADSVSEAAFASDIVTDERNISTTVSLMPGQTLALGGLISENETESVSGVPLLSDIPYIGAAFRSTSTTSEQRMLNVLLTAEIID